jgi:hypothetical protein
MKGGGGVLGGWAASGVRMQKTFREVATALVPGVLPSFLDDGDSYEPLRVKRRTW